MWQTGFDTPASSLRGVGSRRQHGSCREKRGQGSSRGPEGRSRPEGRNSQYVWVWRAPYAGAEVVDSVTRKPVFIYFVVICYFCLIN